MAVNLPTCTKPVSSRPASVSPVLVPLSVGEICRRLTTEAKKGTRPACRYYTKEPGHGGILSMRGCQVPTVLVVRFSCRSTPGTVFCVGSHPHVIGFNTKTTRLISRSRPRQTITCSDAGNDSRKAPLPYFFFLFVEC